MCLTSRLLQVRICSRSFCVRCSSADFFPSISAGFRFVLLVVVGIQLLLNPFLSLLQSMLCWTRSSRIDFRVHRQPFYRRALHLVRLEPRKSSLFSLGQKSTQANPSMYNKQETTHRVMLLQTRDKQRGEQARNFFRAHESSSPMSRNFCLISSFVSSERSERCKLALRPPMMLRGG